MTSPSQPGIVIRLGGQTFLPNPALVDANPLEADSVLPHDPGGVLQRRYGKQYFAGLEAVSRRPRPAFRFRSATEQARR